MSKDLQRKKSPLTLPKPMPFPQQQRCRIDGFKENLREQNSCVLRQLPAAAASELLCPITRNRQTQAKHREEHARDPGQSKAQPLAHSYKATTSSELRMGKNSHSLNIKALLLVCKLPQDMCSYRFPGSFLILL